MRWLKRDMRKAGIAVAGLLLLLVWVPVSAVGAYEGTSDLATPITATVQATPTEDATVTALNKEKLAQEVQQLKNQNAPDLLGWLRTNAAILLSTLVVVIGGLIGLFRWFGDRRDAQDKDLKAQAEERFKTAVTALGDEKESVQVSGAILLRSFLKKDDKEIYERYYTQIFDLVVAHLRLPRTPRPSEDPDGIPQSPVDPTTPLPLTTLSQALIMVFKEVFPLARDIAGGREKDKAVLQSLDAADIQLDYAYLSKADLKRVWMPGVSLRKAKLIETDLNGAALGHSDLSEANLIGANLTGTDLGGISLSGADLGGVNLSGASLTGADLSGASLGHANLSGANLSSVNLTGADLTGADLSGASLDWAILNRTNLSRANLSKASLNWANLLDAQTLKDTKLHEIKGLDEKQVAACKARGAIIDEDLTASASQSTVIPSPPPQSNDVQASSALPTQGSLPPPETAGSRTASSTPSDEGQAQPAPSIQGSTPTPDTGGGSAPSSKPSPGA